MPEPHSSATGLKASYTNDVFAQLCRLVHDRTGIVLDDNKRDMVYSRLSRRLRVLGIEDFGEYCQRLTGADDGELQECINALTTNLTAFFRERHHFDFLASEALPKILDRQGGRTPRLRIWSAGCSIGKEPYSIAMTLARSLRPEQLADSRILATDLDTEVLAQAASGIYPLDGLEGITDDQRRHYFVRGTGRQQGFARVREELRGLIAFRRLNLMAPWPMRGPFDIIFCRNVVIYFDKPTQGRLFDRFADILSYGGYLFIGHSESLHNVSERFELIGRSIYRKCK